MDKENQENRWPEITLRQLRYALAAADGGNVTEASRRLNVSQPAVSAAIAALEAHYATPLFVRQPGHGVKPTRFGEVLFAEVRGLLKQARAVAGLSPAPGPARGEISLGIYQALAPYYLPAILQGLGRAMPGLRVNFFEETLDGLVSRLHNGNADLCITYDVGLDEEIDATTLYTLRPFILAAPGHPAIAGKQARLHDLQGQDLVLLDQEASAQYVLGLLHARGVRPGRIVRAQSFELQRSLVANGLGLALVHTRPLSDRSYDGKPLVCIPVSDRIEPQRVALTASRRHRRTPLVQASASAIVDLFAILPQPAVTG